MKSTQLFDQEDGHITKAGQFYAVGTGIPEALIRAPHRLGHHAADPLTEREIMQRAAG
ncbi:hypothetical protein ACIBKY_29035 [Nonomuraea sp. NPDC050394]|uniref:hypothetical protein n=1 Tax=Nonomuraea sp. NPDC050394 TaxID=3364363 RepID=UPI00379C3E08